MEGTRMRLRSQVPLQHRNTDEKEREAKRQKRIAVETAPFIGYQGKMLYYHTFHECAESAETLLKLAESAETELVLGFDLEWPFSFSTGPGKVALMQISPNLDVCYLLQVSEMKNLPKSITELLTHPKVRLTGINIKNDIRKISRDFKGFDVEKAIENCIDLGPLANSVESFTQRWSMEKLVKHFFEMRISKDKAVRMSQWNVVPLSKKQQVYAAIDAYASLKLYQHLKKLESEIVEEEIIED